MEVLQEILAPATELLKEFLGALILTLVAAVLGILAHYLRKRWGINLDLAQLEKKKAEDERFDQIVETAIVAAQQEYKHAKGELEPKAYREGKKLSALQNAVAWAAQEGIERTVSMASGKVEGLLKQVKAKL